MNLDKSSVESEFSGSTCCFAVVKDMVNKFVLCKNRFRMGKYITKCMFQIQEIQEQYCANSIQLK